MKQRSLQEALELSPDHSAFRVGATNGAWQVRQENDQTYTLIHIPFNPPGYPGMPTKPEVLPYPGLEALLADESRLNALLSGRDWFVVDDETKKRFKLPG